MSDDERTRGEFEDELATARRRIAELEACEAEHRRGIDALRDSEQRYRALFDGAYDAIHVADEADRIVDVNQRACELFGYSREEMLRLRVADLQAPEVRGHAGSILRDEVARHGGASFETVDLRRDGTRLPVEVTISLGPGPQGNLYFSVVRDITERQRAEAALRESEERLRLALEAGEMGLWDWDVRTKLSVWNDQERALIGLSPVDDTADVQEFMRHIHPDDLPRVNQALTQTIEQGTAFDQEFRVILPDGRVRWLYGGGRAYRDEHGRIVRLVGVTYDVTEQVRAQRLLDTLNRAALALAPTMTLDEIFGAVAAELGQLGLHTLLYPLDETQRLVMANYLDVPAEALAQIGALAGRNMDELAFPVDAVAAFGEVITEHKTLYTEDITGPVAQVLGLEDAGQVAEVVRLLGIRRGIGAPLMMDDEVRGVLAVLADELTPADVPAMTAFAHQVAAAWRKAQLLQDLQRHVEELKRTQEQLVQAQKMEAIGRLAGGIAHDFNNLLTSITGYSDLLLLGLDAGNPMRDDVQEISRAADRAADLTRQLLAFSRKQILQPKVLDLNLVVTSADKMLRRLIGEDIVLLTRLAFDLGMVEADPSQLEQVIMNLAVNSRDAMPQGGRLTIETRNVYLDEAYTRQHLAVPPGPYVQLAVSDTGVGMDAATQAHLFEPFFTTKEVGKGTGLGLATVYGIIKQSGGHIWCYSEVGRGTTFKVYLPRLDRPAEAGSVEAAATRLHQGQETILLVEDADMVRHLASRILTHSGYTVWEARNGLDALAVCAKHTGPLHLLITDVVMPEMGGRDLADQLTARYPGLKVLFMSGYTDEAIVNHGMLAPGLAFLQKPFGPAALTRKVREVLGLTRS